MINQFSKVTIKNLVNLGYNPNFEAKWIYNMCHNEFENYGHSTTSYMYTYNIVLNIIKNDYNIWSKYNAHIDYQTIFNNFYFYGCPNQGNKLIIYNFIKKDEHNALKIFRFNQKKLKKSFPYSELEFNDLLPLLNIINGKNTNKK
jgi:hypothetical protein